MTTPPETQKELKVKIPRDLQIKLHSVKILHGKLICDVVAEALVDYFAAQDEPAARPDALQVGGA